MKIFTELLGIRNFYFLTKHNNKQFILKFFDKKFEEKLIEEAATDIISNEIKKFPVKSFSEINKYEEKYINELILKKDNCVILGIKPQENSDLFLVKFKKIFFENDLRAILFKKNLKEFISFFVEIKDVFLTVFQENKFTKEEFKEKLLDFFEDFLVISKNLIIEKSKSLFTQLFKANLQVLDPDVMEKSLIRRYSVKGKIEPVLFSLPEQSEVGFVIQSAFANSPEIKHSIEFLKYYHQKYQTKIRIEMDQISNYKKYVLDNNIIVLHFKKNGELVFINKYTSPYTMINYNLLINDDDENERYQEKLKFDSIFKKLPNLKEKVNSILNCNPNLERNIPRNINYIDEKKNIKYNITFQKNMNLKIKSFYVIFELKSYKLQNILNAHLKRLDNLQILNFDDQPIEIKLSNLNINRNETYLNEFIPYFSTKKNNEDFEEIVEDTSKLEMNRNCITQNVFSFIKSMNIESKLKKSKSLFSINKKLLQQDDTLKNLFKPFPDICKFKNDDDKVDKISFNILEIGNLLEKHRIVWVILEKANFFNFFNVPIQNFCDFLHVLEYKYNKRNNPFHNYDHGIAVMHNCYYFTLLMGEKLPKLESLALIFSGLCHDVNHRGKNNAFECSSLSKIALRYHDKSVLEQYHAATTFKILSQEKTNVFINTTLDMKNFRKFIISNILYTDMKEHFAILAAFEKKLSSLEDKREEIYQNEENQLLLSGFLLHTADFAGAAKEFPLSKVWSERVNKEFSNQYKEEGDLGLTQTPYMKDLEKPKIMSKAEMGFLKVIVSPLWIQANTLFDKALEEPVKNLENSIKNWEQIFQKYSAEENEIELKK